MTTIKEIEEKTMSESKRAGAKNDVLAFYIGRPISYACTIPFLKLKTNPNTITYWSIVFEIVGFIVIYFYIVFSYHINPPYIK